MFAPLMFIATRQFMPAALTAAVIIAVLRRGVLPRVLDRVLPIQAGA
jgi:hypothetical protein